MEDTDDLVDYARQQEMNEELDLDNNKIHIIVGCGGIGFWLGMMLAMMGQRNFYLIEPQKIDATNLNRLPVPQTWIGLNKAVALRKTIRYLRPHTSITVLQEALDKEDTTLLTSLINELRGPYYVRVWDTTDDAVVQKTIFKCLREMDLSRRYTKIGYEGFKIGVYNNFDVWVNQETYRAGYQTSRANAVTSAVAAGMGMFYGLLGLTKDVDYDLKSLLTEYNHGTTPQKKKGARPPTIAILEEETESTPF